MLVLFSIMRDVPVLLKLRSLPCDFPVFEWENKACLKKWNTINYLNNQKILTIIVIL